jgi:hypothetical protein
VNGLRVITESVIFGETQIVSHSKVALKKKKRARHWWLTSVILASQEAEIWKIAAQSQPGKIVPQDPISKNSSQKRAGGVGQGVGNPGPQKKGGREGREERGKEGRKEGKRKTVTVFNQKIKLVQVW